MVETVGPRWSHKPYRVPVSEAEGHSMILEISEGLWFNHNPNKKQSILFYIPNFKFLVICLVKSAVLLINYVAKMFLKMKMRQLQFPHNHRAKNNNVCVMMVLHKKCNARSNVPRALQKICPGHIEILLLSTLQLDYAPSFNQSDDRNLKMRYIIVLDASDQPTKIDLLEICSV